jgi:hypothetical protein
MRFRDDRCRSLTLSPHGPSFDVLYCAFDLRLRHSCLLAILRSHDEPCQLTSGLAKATRNKPLSRVNVSVSSVHATGGSAALAADIRLARKMSAMLTFAKLCFIAAALLAVASVSSAKHCKHGGVRSQLGRQTQRVCRALQIAKRKFKEI